MQIKKYTAPSLKEAVEIMKNELGGEALILSSRVVKSSPGNKYYEITAGLEKNTKEFHFNRTAVEKKQPVKVNENYKHPAQVKKPKFSKDNIKDIIRLFAGQEVNRSVIVSIMNELKKYQEFINSSNIDNYVISSISSLIPHYKFSFNKTGSSKTIALVGPTGVGKTTCIAKLAVIAKIIQKKKVGLIAADTYRLGAIDQLKVFSEISNIEMLVAYTPEDMVNHYNKFADKDIILIDTAGRSQKNAQQIIETKKLLKAVPVDECFLVLSAVSGVRTMYDIVEKFKPLKYSSAIFTKIDEAAVFGNILNTILHCNLPAAYMTNGQVIPDDILSCEPEFIARMIYKGAITK